MCRTITNDYLEKSLSVYENLVLQRTARPYSYEVKIRLELTSDDVGLSRLIDLRSVKLLVVKLGASEEYSARHLVSSLTTNMYCAKRSKAVHKMSNESFRLPG